MQNISPSTAGICSRVTGDVDTMSQLKYSTPPSSYMPRRVSPHSYQFPDGEERYNIQLAKSIKDNMDSPDYFNLKCPRAPPNKTISEAHLGNTGGYNLPMRHNNMRCQTNNNDNTYSPKSKDHLKFSFTHSLGKHNEVQPNKQYDATPKSRSTLTNNNLDMTDSPPLYCDIIREGQIDSQCSTTHSISSCK